MSSDDERTIACKLDEARKEKRRPKVEALFVNELLERHEIESGWEFQFPADDPVLERVFEFVNAERKCCPFFQFQVFVDPDGGPTAPKTDTSAGARRGPLNIWRGRTSAVLGYVFDTGIERRSQSTQKGKPRYELVEHSRHGDDTDEPRRSRTGDSRDRNGRVAVAVVGSRRTTRCRLRARRPSVGASSLTWL